MSLTIEDLESLTQTVKHRYQREAIGDLREISYLRKRLGALIESPQFPRLPDYEQSLVLKQLSLMVDLIRILVERVEKFR